MSTPHEHHVAQLTDGTGGASCYCHLAGDHLVASWADIVPSAAQVRGIHAPEGRQPDVDLAGISAPGGEPWARTDRILSRGAAQRRARLEQIAREQERGR